MIAAGSTQRIHSAAKVRVAFGEWVCPVQGNTVPGRGGESALACLGSFTVVSLSAS